MWARIQAKENIASATAGLFRRGVMKHATSGSRYGIALTRLMICHRYESGAVGGPEAAIDVWSTEPFDFDKALKHLNRTKGLRRLKETFTVSGPCSTNGDFYKLVFEKYSLKEQISIVRKHWTDFFYEDHFHATIAELMVYCLVQLESDNEIWCEFWFAPAPPRSARPRIFWHPMYQLEEKWNVFTFNAKAIWRWLHKADAHIVRVLVWFLIAGTVGRLHIPDDFDPYLVLDTTLCVVHIFHESKFERIAGLNRFEQPYHWLWNQVETRERALQFGHFTNYFEDCFNAISDYKTRKIITNCLLTVAPDSFCVKLEEEVKLSQLWDMRDRDIQLARYVLDYHKVPTRAISTVVSLIGKPHGGPTLRNDLTLNPRKRRRLT